MTRKDREALDKALERAERDGITVTGQGTRKSDGARVYSVSSASQPGRWYLVVIEGGRLHCDCPARGYCKHRAAVHARLIAEREAEQRQAERQAEREHAARLLASEREQARDAAILYRNTRPFSIWRAEQAR